MPASADAPAIHVKNLTKSYGALAAVQGIDLTIERGEVFGLLGPNGAGKTTTVEILEGLRPRTGGDVSVLGLDPATQANQVKDRIGVCLQSTNLPDKMKVGEALDLFSSFYSRTADRDTILGRMQLLDKKDAFYKTLSGGQKQRVALSLALLNDPDLLFLDEPTTGLDPQVRHEIHGVIQELKENRRTILITTHYIEEAERLCNRVAIIDAGKIIEQGTPRDIQTRVLGHTAVEVTTDAPVPLDTLPERLRDEKRQLGNENRTLTMQSESPAALIVELVKWIDASGLHLIDIHMKRPTLEDVFIELTGKNLREA